MKKRLLEKAIDWLMQDTLATRVIFGSIVIVCCFLTGLATIAAVYYGGPWVWRHVLVHLPWEQIFGAVFFAVVFVICVLGITVIGSMVLLAFSVIVEKIMSKKA